MHIPRQTSCSKLASSRRESTTIFFSDSYPAVEKHDERADFGGDVSFSSFGLAARRIRPPRVHPVLWRKEHHTNESIVALFSQDSTKSDSLSCLGTHLMADDDYWLDNEMTKPWLFLSENWEAIRMHIVEMKSQFMAWKVLVFRHDINGFAFLTEKKHTNHS